MKPTSPTFRALAWAAASAAFFSLLACSSQELYSVGQSWQQQECRKLLDRAERSRCEKSNSVSYEKYRAESQANPPRTP
jgi:hypothetical protein